MQIDYENEPAAEWFSWEGPAGPFHDSSNSRLSLVSLGTIGAWEPRRFRANVVLSGAGEDALVGMTIGVGGARLEVTKQIDRCQMVTRPQPGGIDRDVDVLRTIHKERAGNLAVGALVVQPGTLRVGDAVSA